MTTEIKNKVNEIIAQYNPEELSPFPYKRIANDMPDLSIDFIAFPDKAQDISGAILYDSEKGHFNILINQDNSKGRQYLNLARGLGHYFLHQEYLKESDGMLYFRDTSVEPLFAEDNSPERVDSKEVNDELQEIEKQANTFASYLIMPENLVRTAWSKIDDIQSMASVFQVAPSVMAYRLENLSLIEA